MSVQTRPAADVEFDVLALGEVMLRLDPGAGRIRTARTFEAWEGGGEYNVARGLSRCFGMRASVLTALVDNEVGHLIENLILAGGVDTSMVTWASHDGIGRNARNGLNFTERGFGVRGAVGVSDRGHTACAQLTPGDVDFEDLFTRRGVRWLHTGGIFAALSPASAELAEAAMIAARRAGTRVSYDLNYRPSLWRDFGGQQRALEVNRRLAPLVDVMFGNEEDFTACLGYPVQGVDSDFTDLDPSAFEAMIEQVADDYPTLQAVGTTLRAVHSASSNDWGAIGWTREQGFAQATTRREMAILDRVGGGDSFASGFIYGLMERDGVQDAVDIGAAHGALAMTTPGDTSMASVDQVLALAGGGSARVNR